MHRSVTVAQNHGRLRLSGRLVLGLEGEYLLLWLRCSRCSMRSAYAARAAAPFHWAAARRAGSEPEDCRVLAALKDSGVLSDHWAQYGVDELTER